jgi:hypothetical protein
MRLAALILVSLSVWLVSCGGSAQLAQPEIRTVTYAGSDWQADDIAVSVQPAGDGWRVEVTSTAALPAATLLLELRFDKSLAAQNAVPSCGDGELELLASGRPGGVGLGLIMPEGKTIRPGPIMSFTLAPATRQPSVVIGGNGPSKVSDLVGVAGAGTVDLTWSYRLPGDNDQNSEVNIGDLSPMGPRLGNSTTDGEDDAADEVVDADGNGEVNIADLTTIGGNFLLGITGYNVYGADGADLLTATSTLLGNVPFAQHSKPGARLLFSYQVTDPVALANGYFYVAAVFNDSMEGDASNVVNVGGGPPPILFAVPPAGETTVDPELSQAPSLALLAGNGSDIEDGAPLLAYATAAGELRLGYYRDDAWHFAAPVAGSFLLPQLLIEGGSWWVIAYDAAAQAIVRLEFDKTLTLQSSEDVVSGFAAPPVLLEADLDGANSRTGVAYALNTAPGYQVWCAQNGSGSFVLSPVTLSPSEQVLSLAFKYDATGEPWLLYTRGEIVTTGAVEINFTLERSIFDGVDSWGFPAAIAYPDSPLQLDLDFASDGTPKLAFNAARDTLLLPPISAPLSFDGVVGTLDAGTWSFETYYTGTLDYSLGGGFPPTTATLELALDLGNYWAREGELGYTLGNGDLTFLLADFSPQAGSLTGEARYSVESGGTYSDSAYFTGSPGLPQSWGEQGSVHGAAYLELQPLDSADLLSGNFEGSSRVLFWRK